MAYQHAIERRTELVRKRREATNIRIELERYSLLPTCTKDLVTSSAFQLFILFCIILAGVLVGLKLSPDLERERVVVVLDQFVIYVFLIEVILKIISEGLHPHLYFIGPNWHWNCFDFTISIVSVLPVGYGSVLVLRVLRFARISRFLTYFPRAQMILDGLVAASYYNMIIFLLLVLIFYAFAVLGILLFRQNDPWNFGIIEVAVMSMLRIATLESWGDLLYINYYGCDMYPVPYYTLNATLANPALGGVTYCDNPNPKPWASSFFFISFIVICTFVVLSLFISVITMSMAEVMEASDRKIEGQRVQNEKKRYQELISMYMKDPSELPSSILRLKYLITAAFSGKRLNNECKPTLSHSCDVRNWYRRLAFDCRRILRSKKFTGFIVFIIVLASIAVGIETMKSQTAALETTTNICDNVVQYTFLIEFVMKVVAEEFEPWRYFDDRWNVLDLVILVVVFIPTSQGTSFLALRMLRLLRLFKLIRVFPQARIIVVALGKGIVSIITAALVLFMTIYVFAILGVILFSQNDPWHFSTLKMALLVLFDVATLDNWTTAEMYISLYGCAQYPWNYPELCTNSQPQFAASVIFYTAFIFIAGLIMVTLFIGVVNVCVEQAQTEENLKTKVKERAFEIADAHKLTREEVHLYGEVFDAIDFSHSHQIDRLELQFGLEVAGFDSNLTKSRLDKIFRMIDTDKSSSEIDFAEFLKFMIEGQTDTTIVDDEPHHDYKFEPVSIDAVMGSSRTFRSNNTGSPFEISDYPWTNEFVMFDSKPQFEQITGGRNHRTQSIELGQRRELGTALSPSPSSPSEPSSKRSVLSRNATLSTGYGQLDDIANMRSLTPHQSARSCLEVHSTGSKSRPESRSISRMPSTAQSPETKAQLSTELFSRSTRSYSTVRYEGQI